MSGHDVVLTVDIGGSGVKLSAYSLTAHRCVGTSRTAWEPGSMSGDGAEFNVESWWRTTLGAIGLLTARLDDRLDGWIPVGVTVDAIRIPFVLLDADGSVVRPPLTSADSRATAEVADLQARYGNEAMYRLTGHWITPKFGLPKLLWLRRREPDAYARVRRILQLHDWFVYRLCGTVYSEPSSAAMSQLLAADAADWAWDLLADVGIEASLLPQLRPAGTLAGRILPGVASACGLPASTRVYIGGGDTQMSALSAGAIRTTPLPVLVAGTTAPLQWSFPQPPALEDCYPFIRSRQLLNGWWAVEGNAAAVGSVLAPLRVLDSSLCGDALGAELGRIGLEDVQIPWISQMLVAAGNPLFSPESWANAPFGVIVNRTSEHTAADVYQVALTCSAVGVACLLDTIQTRLGNTDRLVATGGLATAEHWAQLVADTAAVTVTVPHSDTAGIGGATVVTGEQLWTEADDAASREFRPGPSGIEPELRSAYLDFWISGVAVRERMVSCER